MRAISVCSLLAIGAACSSHAWAEVTVSRNVGSNSQLLRTRGVAVQIFTLHFRKDILSPDNNLPDA